MRSITIIGSSHPAGETVTKGEHLTRLCGGESINLGDYNISYYDYQHHNRDDDFIPLMRRLVTDFDVLIFATPVYWYSMSGIMKVFFDRLSDLLKIEKDLGRQLRGKGMAVLSSSNGNNPGDAFWLPFQATSKYLGMHYLGNLHTYDGKDSDQVLVDFGASIQENWAALSKLD